MDQTIVENVSKYLIDKHLKNVSQNWIREQISSLKEFERRDASNVIFKRILECDWKNNNERFSELPPGLDLQLLNETKRTFNGNYVLQISGIVDISRAFTENKFDAEDDEDDNDDDTVSENELAKLMKGKAVPAKRKEKRSWSNGKRCLEMALFDGKTECLAMEYVPLPFLHDNLLGAKVLLSGPLDVYAGIILLRPNNIKLLSDMTFYPPASNPSQAQSNQNTNQTATQPSNPSSNQTNQIAEDDFDDLLLNDDLYLDMTI